MLLQVCVFLPTTFVVTYRPLCTSLTGAPVYPDPKQSLVTSAPSHPPLSPDTIDGDGESTPPAVAPKPAPTDAPSYFPPIPVGVAPISPPSLALETESDPVIASLSRLALEKQQASTILPPTKSTLLTPSPALSTSSSSSTNSASGGVAGWGGSLSPASSATVDLQIRRRSFVTLGGTDFSDIRRRFEGEEDYVGNGTGRRASFEDGGTGASRRPAFGTSSIWATDGSAMD